MSILPKQHSQVHQHFKEGLYVMHDSDHSWAEQHKDATQTKTARNLRNTQQVLRNIAQRSFCITEEYCHRCDCITVVGMWENASRHQ